MSSEAYGPDLAYIHDASCVRMAHEAAGRLTEELKKAGFEEGRVIDVGCGSGILARALVDAGYPVLGVDISDAMVELARARVPEAEFRVGSFVSVDLPRCVAVTAIGEVFNYLFDSKNNEQALETLFRRIYQALEPGGMFLFDVATPERAKLGPPQRTFFEGPDWAVLVEFSVEPGVLTRRNTSFRKIGDTYRRKTEVHRLTLVDPASVLKSLRATEFDAQVISSYGTSSLPNGIAAFLARK